MIDTKDNYIALDKLSLGDLFIFLNGLNERTYGVYLGHEYNDTGDRIINYTMIFIEQDNKQNFNRCGEKTWTFSSIVGRTLEIPEKPVPLLQLGMGFFKMAYGMEEVEPYEEVNEEAIPDHII